MKKFFLIILFCVPATLLATEEAGQIFYSKNPPKLEGRKGQFYFHLGYNRSFFKPTDIVLKGDGYNITLKNVEAEDRPSAIEKPLVYLDPGSLSVPQWTIRFGYFLDQHQAVSLGIDHMKYVMTENQVAQISGEIAPSASEKYAGTYDNEDIVLAKDFVIFEHTDGFNFVSVDYDYYFKVLQAQFGLDLDISLGAGLGAIIPRSDVRVFGKGLNNFFHVAGLAGAVKLGVHQTFSESYMLSFIGKWGHADMPDVLTTENKKERASQKVDFFEVKVAFGLLFDI